MTESLGGIGGEVKNISEAVFGEEPVDERDVEDGALDEGCAFIEVGLKTAGEVVEGNDLEASIEQELNDVRADESGGSSYENLRLT